MIWKIEESYFVADPRPDNPEEPATADAAPIELWRDPAILRIQPSRRRLWFWHCFLPLLAGVFALMTPVFDKYVVEPYLADTLGFVSISIQQLGGLVTMAQTLDNRELRLIELNRWVFPYVFFWSLVPAFHVWVNAGVGLSSVWERLKERAFRTDLALSSLDADSFLRALVRPHIRPVLAGWLFILLCIWSQVVFFEARYETSFRPDFVYLIGACLLNSAGLLCGMLREADFERFKESTRLAAKIGDVLVSCLIGLILFVPFIGYAASSNYFTHEDKSFAVSGLLLLMALLFFGLASHARYLWGRLGRFLYRTGER